MANHNPFVMNVTFQDRHPAKWVVICRACGDYRRPRILWHTGDRVEAYTVREKHTDHIVTDALGNIVNE